MEQIMNVLLQTSMVPNLATAVAAPAKADRLAELDRITDRIVTRIQASLPAGGYLSVISLDANSKLHFNRVVTVAELRRLQRQFIHMNKNCQVDSYAIQGLFVSYLNSQMASQK